MITETSGFQTELDMLPIVEQEDEKLLSLPAETDLFPQMEELDEVPMPETEGELLEGRPA